MSGCPRDWPGLGKQRIGLLRGCDSGYDPAPQKGFCLAKDVCLVMNGFDSSTALWLLVVAQFLGVLSAWVARLSEGSCCQAVSQYVFFGVLPLMGVTTAAAMAIGPGCWLTCSATLAIMVLTVTCDFRRSREAATW